MSENYTDAVDLDILRIVGSFHYLGAQARGTHVIFVPRDDPRIRTAATDGVVVYVNPDFYDKCLEQDRESGKAEADQWTTASLILHELVHVFHAHVERLGTRNPILWNIACDYWIHCTYPELFPGWKLPPGGLFDNKYRGMIEEEIYEDLLDQIEQMKQDQKGQPGGDGQNEQDGEGGSPGPTQNPNGKDAHSDMLPFPGSSEDARDSQIVKEGKIATALHEHTKRYAGKLPGGLQRSVEAMGSAKVAWKTHLQRVARKVRTKKGKDWTRPNMMRSELAWETGTSFPGKKYDKACDAVIINDVSGSVDDQLLQEFANEIRAISQLMRAKTTVIPVDTEVHDVQVFPKGAPIKLHTTGGGGTSFVPGFEYIKGQGRKLDPSLIVYMTDGYCDEFPPDPGIPTIWCLLGHYVRNDFNPPFGTVVRVKE